MDYFRAIGFDGGQWLALGVCAFMVGATKTGVPGLGIMNVLLLAMCFQAKASTGILLPLLAFADLFAVAWYRRHARWGHVLRLLPWSLCGVALGSVVVRFVSDLYLKPLIGVIVLAMLAITFWREWKPSADLRIPTSWQFAAGMGLTAGLSTQLANAAGPVMLIYLLAMRLPKHEFIGTGAWYFLIVNWLKMPLFIAEGRITFDSLKSDLLVLPLVVLGAMAGIIILQKLPQKAFNNMAFGLETLGALYLTSTIRLLF